MSLSEFGVIESGNVYCAEKLGELFGWIDRRTVLNNLRKLKIGYVTVGKKILISGNSFRLAIERLGLCRENVDLE